MSKTVQIMYDKAKKMEGKPYLFRGNKIKITTVTSFDTHVEIKGTNGNDSPKNWDFYSLTEFNDWFANCMSLPASKEENGSTLSANAEKVIAVNNLGGISDALKSLFPEVETVKDALVKNLTDLQDGKVTVEVSNQINNTANNIMNTVTAKIKVVDLLTRGRR